MQSALTVLAAYCLGSVSFAIAVSRLMQLPDPRTYGSGNPGATNVLRTGKRAAAALTLAGDAGKGWLAVWLPQLYAPEAAALAGLAVFLGHLFPLFHRFKGGKGVATAAGVVFGLDVWLGLGSLATWIVIAAFFRYASLASLVAALFAPFFAWYIGLSYDMPLVGTSIAALLAWRHKGNLGRVLSRTQPRISPRKT